MADIPALLCFGSVPSSLRSLPYPPGDRVHYLSLGSTGVNRGTAGSSGREAGPRGVGVPTPYPSPKTKKKTLQTGHPAEVNPFSPPDRASWSSGYWAGSLGCLSHSCMLGGCVQRTPFLFRIQATHLHAPQSQVPEPLQLMRLRGG